MQVKTGLVILAVAVLSTFELAAQHPHEVRELDEGRVAEADYDVRWQSPGLTDDARESWRAVNHAQGLHTRFDTTGVRISTLSSGSTAVRFRFVGFGRGADVRTREPLSLDADGRRMHYRRSEITEWYRNDSLGVEQGFTLSTAPENLPPTAGSRRLSGARTSTEGHTPAFVVLALDGDLIPQISPDGQAIDFAPPAGGLSVMRYSKLEVIDAQGQRLDSWMELFDDGRIQGIRLVFDDSAAAYPVTVDPLVTSASWSVEGDSTGAHLGWSVAGAGDLNDDGFDDVIVAAPDAPVDLDTDGTVECGPGTDESECAVGVVHAYHGSLSGLSTTPNWTAEGDQAGARFGHAISRAGDVDNDGFADVLIGQPDYDGTAGADEGRAHLYRGSASGLAATAAWTADGGQADAHYGWSVSGAGDVNGDDLSDWIVGAPDFDGPAGADEGRAFAYHGSDTSLSTLAAWTADGDQADARFGFAVAGAGNVNGNEFDDVIVGSPFYDDPSDPGQIDHGRALIYLGTTAFGGLAPFPVWSAVGEDREIHYGWAVTSAGDSNGDGRDDWVVGAPDDGPNNEGRAYAYLGAKPLPPTSLSVWESFGDGNARFAAAIGNAEDIDLDGRSDVVVGAAGWKGTSIDSRFGRARLFYSPSVPTRNWAWETAGIQPQEQLGFAVAGAGDVNRDGVADLIVGAPNFHRGKYLQGRALVFHGARGVTAATLADRLGIPILDGSPTWRVESPDGVTQDQRSTGDAVYFGPIPGSVLISTGRAVDEGLGDTDWGLTGSQAPDGLPDATFFEFSTLVPAGKKTLCFGSQFITSEVPQNTDTARFCVNRTGGTCNPVHDLSALAYRPRNPPMQHCIDVRNKTQVFLRFEVADGDSDNNGSDDGSQDSALLVSRFYYSGMEMPADVLAETVDGYFKNPAPADVSRTAGTATASRELIIEPSISSTFALTIGYTADSTHDGALGTRWTHSFETATRKFDDGGAGDFPGTVLVNVGSGATYFTETETCSASGLACSSAADCPPTEQCLFVPGSYRATHGQDMGSIVVSDDADETVTYTSEADVIYEFTRKVGVCAFGTKEGEKCDMDADCLGGGICTFDELLLTVITDENGHETALDYDIDDRLLSVTSTAGKCYGFDYDNKDRLTAVSVGCPFTDNLPQARLTYNSAGMLATSTDIGGLEQIYTYFEDGRIASATTDDGTLIFENEYESFQGLGLDQTGFRIVRQRDARDADPGRRLIYEEESVIDVDRLGRSSERSFDVKGRLARVVGPTGVREEYVYDRENRIVEKRRQLPSEAVAGVISSAVYDSFGNTVAQTGFPGRCIGGAKQGDSCNAGGECPQSTCGLGTTGSYGPDNGVQSKADAAGNTWSFAFDPNGNLVSERDPLGHEARHTYELVSVGKVNPWPVSTIDTRGNTSTCEYDQASGNLLSATDPLGNTVRHTYDDRGRRTATTDPFGVANPGAGHTSCVEYLESDRLARRGFLCTDDCQSCELEWQFTYDSQGRLRTRTRPGGAQFENRYTASGQVAEEIGPLGKTARFEYDITDRLIGGSVSSPAENGSGTLPLQFTEFLYDDADRLTGVRAFEAEGGNLLAEVAGEYDETGNLVCLTSPTGDTTKIRHDLLGRAVRSGPAADCQSEIYAPLELHYNAQGLLASLTNARGDEIVYQYDAGGRLLETTSADASIAHIVDANGNKAWSDRDGASITRTFDPLDRMISRTDEFGATVGYVFDAAGNIAELHYPSGVSVTYAYDGLQRLTSVTDWNSRITSYSYDARGNLESAALPGGAVVSYSYDASNRIVGIDDPGVGYSATYARNTAGRTISANETLPLDPEPGLSYPVADQAFAHGDRDQLISRGSFDADGNMVSATIDGTGTAMTYDAFNQLLSVSRTGQGADAFRYDADGLRVETDRDGTVRRYVYDVTTSAARLLEERDSAGAVVARYVHGMGLISREEPSVPGSYRVHHYDQRGSTIALTDIGGTITDRYAYDPFGRLVASTGATDNRFLYDGRDGVIDDDNGLLYMRSRYFAPELMRFVQQDFVFPGIMADSQSLNRYAFVLGNPIDHVDPNGDVVTAIVVTVVVVAAAAAVGGVAFAAIECLPGSNAGTATADFVSGEPTQLQLGCTFAEASGAATEGAIVGGTTAASIALAASPIPGARWIAAGVTVAGGTAGGLAGGLTEELVETRGVENNFGPFEDQPEDQDAFSGESVARRTAKGAITSTVGVVAGGAAGAGLGKALGTTGAAAATATTSAKVVAKLGAGASGFAAGQGSKFLFNRLWTDPEEVVEPTLPFSPTQPVPPRVQPTGAPGAAATNGAAADVLSPLIFPIPGVVRTMTCGCACEVWK